ncbi:MAG: hypothetical protein LBD20_00870 [Spirochaetaceae bacterium]|jgi:hypothetical protein|nr:hypothetical protein [Spirochaetaceae bacterium]
MERGRTFAEEARAVVRQIVSGTHFSLTGGLEPHSGWVLARCKQEYGTAVLAAIIQETVHERGKPPAGHFNGYNNTLIAACGKTADTALFDVLEHTFKTYALPRFTYYSQPAGSDGRYGEWVVEAAGCGITLRTALALETADCIGQKDLMDIRVRPRFLGYDCEGKIPRLLMEGRHGEFTEKFAVVTTIREAVRFLSGIITDL